MGERIAVVTGGNKGIGYSCVKQLAERISGPVYLTSRNEKLGHEAVEKVKKDLGSAHADKIRYHQLDVTNQASIDAFRDFLKEKHGGLDILISNAGIMLPDEQPLKERNDVTIAVNYTGVKNLNHALFPLLRSNARVVINASRAGSLRNLEIESLKAKLTDENLTEKDIDHILDGYLNACKDEKQQEKGYPNPYSMSKILVIALTKVASREMKKDTSRQNILINAVCPGAVMTDMTAVTLERMNFKVGDSLTPDFTVVKTPDEGADTLVYCALLPPNGPHGEFIAERKVLDWSNERSLKETFALIAKNKEEKEKANKN